MPEDDLFGSVSDIFDILTTGLGLMSGEELQAKRNSLDRILEREQTAFKAKQAENWDQWLQPAEWYPASRIVDAHYRDC